MLSTSARPGMLFGLRHGPDHASGVACLTSMAVRPLWLRYSSCSAVQANSPAMDSSRLLSRASRCRFVSLWRHQDSRSSVLHPVTPCGCPLCHPGRKRRRPASAGCVPIVLVHCLHNGGNGSLGHAVQRRQAVTPEPQLLQACEAGNGPKLTQPIGAQLQQCQRREVTYALSLRFRQKSSDALVGPQYSCRLVGNTAAPCNYGQRQIATSTSQCSVIEQLAEETLLLATYRSDRCCPDSEVKGRSDLMPLYDSSRRRSAVSGAKSGTCGHWRSAC